jgi:hypothetical protein
MQEFAKYTCPNVSNKEYAMPCKWAWVPQHDKKGPPTAYELMDDWTTTKITISVESSKNATSKPLMIK